MAYDKTKPTGATPLKTSDDQIRANFEAIETALGADHDFTTGSTQTGKHDKVTFKAPTTGPSLSADEGALYTKTVSTKSELHFKDEDANEVQLTSGGKINAVSGSAKAILRIIQVKFERDELSHYVTITSIWNGDTLTKTLINEEIGYYDFNVTGNCLGVIGVFATSSRAGGTTDPLTRALPWAAVFNNNLRLGIYNSVSLSYFTIGEILDHDNQHIIMTVAYLTDA